MPPAPASSESPPQAPRRQESLEEMMSLNRSSSQLALVSAFVFAIFSGYAFSLLATSSPAGAWWPWCCHDLTGEDAAVLPAFALRTAVQAVAASLALVLPASTTSRLAFRQLLACVAWAATVRNLYWLGSVIRLVQARGGLVGSLFAGVGYTYIFLASFPAYFTGCGLLVGCMVAVEESAERLWKRSSVYYWRTRVAMAMATMDPHSTVWTIACWALLSAGAFVLIAGYVVYLLTPCPTLVSSPSSSRDHDSSSWWSRWWPCPELTKGEDAELARALLPRLAWCSALQVTAAALALALLVRRRFWSCRVLALVALSATAANHCRLARLLGPVFDAWEGEPLGFVVGGGYVFVIFPVVALLSLTALAAEVIRGPTRRRSAVTD